MRSSLICLLCLFTLSGCGLLGPSVEKAQEIAEKRQAEMDAAVADLKLAESELRDLLAQYDAAVKADDKTTAEKLVQLINAALGKKEAAEKVAESAGNVFNSAVQDFEDAKSTSDYIGTVFGWLFAGATALLGGTGAVAVGKTVQSKRRGEALEGTTTAIEKIKNAGPEAWKDAKTDMQANLSTGALKAIEAARP